MSLSIIRELVNRAVEYNNKIQADKKEKTRFIMLLIAVLFCFDYLVFCYHAEKNPFDIFPAIPIKDEKKLINVYLPDLDGKSILKESKKVSVIDDREDFVGLLFEEVINGSDFENTSIVVPVNAYIRKIWIYDEVCAIDVGFSLLERDAKIISGSEDAFDKALLRTITENIPSIKKVILLDRGIPGKRIWEIGAKS